MLSASNKKAILWDLHADIANTAEFTVDILKTGKFISSIAYPPNTIVSDSEEKAIKEMMLIPGIDSALRKVIMEATSVPIFNLLSKIDGVADSSVEGWTGVSLVDGMVEGGEFLHDEFFSTYWNSKSA